jgi:cobalt-zinc-cadmium efflux system membrane fusion protein
MNAFFAKLTKPLAYLALIMVALGCLALAGGGFRIPWVQTSEESPAPLATKLPDLGVELVKDRPHTLAVPEEVLKALGVRTAREDRVGVARKPTGFRSLVMAGSTALDPTLIRRIRARFAPSPSSAEVVQIGQVPEDRAQSAEGRTVFRELRSGDRVNKGDLLATFYSVDVGNKKNDLVDAIYQLKLDQEILQRAEAHAEALSEAFILNARRAVQGDINAVNRAVNTLTTWGIPEEDIQAVRDEAEIVKKRQGKHDKEKEALWARVQVRAPDDGIIIERNVALHEIVADNTTNLFQIAKVDRLAVIAYIPEDELPTLEALPTARRRWTVQTVGSPPVDGFISDIGYIIQPDQHTAVVKGYIDNPKEALRAGQFVTATVALPAPEGLAEVPIDAVVDDGQECVVFVQTNPAKNHFTMRRVQVTHRFDKTAFVRARPFARNEERSSEEEEIGSLPKEPLYPGERVLLSAVGELKSALIDLESQAHKDQGPGQDTKAPPGPPDRHPDS